MFFLYISAVYIISAMVLPFPNWPSFAIVFCSVLTAREVPPRQRISMVLFLLRDIALLPVWALFWMADEVLFPSYRNAKIKEPIFIMSQPRSGTTFLLRTLAEDQDTFLSVKHLEWRFPFISFWIAVDFFKLRGWLENRSYWPDTELGRTCRKIHAHVLGNYEEFGIFLEEKFYHHYFVFRRFPFRRVLERVSQFDNLSEVEKDRLLSTFLRVVQKVYYYRGAGEIFLAKENENVEFCRALIERLPDARVLMICREPKPMLESYLTMSVTCTEVKHGLDPRPREGWHEANIHFRREECRKFVDFSHEISDRRTTVVISFHDFTTSVLATTLRIFRTFELPVRSAFHAYLEKLQAEQNQREKGYINLHCDEPGFEFYEEFVHRAAHHGHPERIVG